MEIETVTTGAPDAGSGQTEASAPKTEAPAMASGSDGKSTGQPAEKAPGQPGSTDRHKIKFGKNEREVTIEELRMYAQKGWASDERFQEAARLRKETEEYVKKANWDKLIEKSTGKPALDFYKEKLKAEIRKAQMTDDERMVASKSEELEKLKAEERQIIEAREERQLKEQEEHYSQQWDKELSEAIKAEGLPQTKYAINRAIQLGKKVVDMGLDPDWTAVVREARAQMHDDLKGVISALKEDPALLAFLGDELGMRISKAVANKKAPVPVMQKKAVESKRDGFSNKEQKQVDVDEWIAKRRKAFENT